MKKFILFILIAIVVTTSYGFFNFDEKNDKKEVTSEWIICRYDRGLLEKRGKK